MSSSASSASPPTNQDIYPEGNEEDARPSTEANRQISSESHPRQGRHARESHSDSEPSDGAQQSLDPHSRQSRHRPDTRSDCGKNYREPRRPSRTAQPGDGKRRIPGLANGFYRDLLNEVIANVCGQGEDRKASSNLLESWNGVSFWSVEEKVNLYSAMEKKGIGDLPSLCKAVNTKTESEIRAYLLLLDRELAKLDKNEDAKYLITEVSAAAEVSEGCERTLERSADAIGRRVLEHEIQMAKEEFGGDWLIDDDFAERIENRFRRSEENNNEEDYEEDYDDTDVPQENSNPEQMDDPYDPSILLNPINFLGLSKNIYMNHATEPDRNYRTLQPISESHGMDSPSIFRSAFHDFHNLTISLTRRLVQASLFQTTTRLRALHGRQTLESVRASDVWAAMDVIGMPEPEKLRQYWVGVPRRYGLRLFTDSKKYRDGRTGTKTGTELTLEEVEQELGGEERNQQEESEVEIDQDGIDEAFDDEEGIWFEKTEEQEYELKVKMEETDEEYEGELPPKKRRRVKPLDDDVFHRVETAYAEALDQKASAEEEERLYGLLNIIPPPRVKIEQVPPPDGAMPLSERRPENWRECIEYQSEWERPLGLVTEDEFRDMESIGRVGRKRRRMLMEQVRERLESIDGESVDGESVDGESELEKTTSDADREDSETSSEEAEEAEMLQESE